jgi:hypothetical protein
VIDRCSECGFDPGDLRRRDMPLAVRAFGRRYRAPLTRGLPGEDLDAVVRRSPGPGVWSALEYGGHVLDIFREFDRRVRAALASVSTSVLGLGTADATTPSWAAVAKCAHAFSQPVRSRCRPLDRVDRKVPGHVDA